MFDIIGLIIFIAAILIFISFRKSFNKTKKIASIEFLKEALGIKLENSVNILKHKIKNEIICDVLKYSKINGKPMLLFKFNETKTTGIKRQFNTKKDFEYEAIYFLHTDSNDIVKKIIIAFKTKEKTAIMAHISSAKDSVQLSDTKYKNELLFYIPEKEYFDNELNYTHISVIETAR